MSTDLIHSDLKNPVYRSWTAFLEDAAKWSPQRVASYQLQEVKRAVKHAYDSTKAYRDMYREVNLRPEMIETLDDLRRFPFVTKEMIRDRLDDFSVPMEGRTYITTGGSTGIPFGMYRDPEAFSKELASKAHQYYRIGWKEGDRQLVFRGLPVETPDHMMFAPEFNELRCSSYHLVPEQMEVYRQKALEYRPEWLRCYPSTGYIFARWLRETGLGFPPIKGILCASENLYDYQKELMSAVFKARVFSHYGHYELAVLAGFCESTDDYHVLPQYGYAELLGKDGKPVRKAGEIGEIVGTSFIMKATPLIRYRTRDYAVFKADACASCGRPYQVWERIEGRLQEFIVTGTGRLISMTAMNFHDDIFDHIRQFQFRQEAKGELVFCYIPNGDCGPAVVEDMRKRLLRKLGNDVQLTMQAVEDIPLTSRGKHRFLIQKLPVPYGDH
jgi:phenylacetate-CoA ligase